MPSPPWICADTVKATGQRPAPGIFFLGAGHPVVIYSTIS
jgi:hypothetical protein